MPCLKTRCHRFIIRTAAHNNTAGTELFGRADFIVPTIDGPLLFQVRRVDKRLANRPELHSGPGPSEAHEGDAPTADPEHELRQHGQVLEDGDGAERWYRGGFLRLRPESTSSAKCRALGWSRPLPDGQGFAQGGSRGHTRHSLDDALAPDLLHTAHQEPGDDRQ
jgi:hypothetical protein